MVGFAQKNSPHFIIIWNIQLETSYLKKLVLLCPTEANRGHNKETNAIIMKQRNMEIKKLEHFRIQTQTEESLESWK